MRSMSDFGVVPPENKTGCVVKGGAAHCQPEINFVEGGDEEVGEAGISCCGNH